MENAKKLTKKETFSTIKTMISIAEDEGFTLPESMTYDYLREFIDHEVELLDNKAAAAQKRAEKKKVEGDILREKVFEVLSAANDFMTVNDIVQMIDDPDVSAQMVTSRLTQLRKLDRIDRESVSVTSESGKTKKCVAYKVKIDVEA